MTFIETKTHSLSKLIPLKTKRVKWEMTTLSANSSTTIANLSGSGMISTIWTTMPVQDKDVRLQVFVDGEVVPSIDIDIATLFLTTFIADSTNFYWSTQNIHGEGGYFNSQGGYFKFPIPYSNGCIVKIKTVSSLAFYAMVDYVPNLNVPYRLKSINRSYTNTPITFSSSDSLDLFTTPIGSPGWFVYFGYEASPDSGTGDRYLERNFAIYIDEESTPSHLSSGTEDFFFGSYYWQLKTGTMSTPVAAVAYRNPNNASNKSAVCIDIMELCNGIYFDSSCRLYVPTEGAVNVGHKCGFLALFYTPSTSAWAQPTSSAVAPNSPTSVSAVAGNGSATVTFMPPVINGGATITSYTVTSSPGNITQTGTSSPIVITGLTNGTAYTFTVTATNSAGTSVASNPSNSVTPVASTVPDAPTGVTATGSDSAASVSFSAPANNGGSAITSYTVTSSPGSLTGTGTGSPITVSGLTNGTSYTFTVHATNVNGNSLESSPSNSITPSGNVNILYDTFTASDGTAVTSHTPDTNVAGNSYAVTYGGTWTINSNKVNCSNAGSSEGFISIDCGQLNGTATCDMTFTSATDATVRGMVLRFGSTSNYIKVFFVKRPSINRIEVRDSAGLISMQNAVGLVDGTTYAVKMVINNDNLKIYLDNVPKFDVTNSRISAVTGTGYGFGLSTGGGDDKLGTWDNLKFTL